MATVMTIGLVLGAGGVVGNAYHAGVLAALAEATGWDPRDADLVVGTSAGSHTAATLRAGLTAADHLARATDLPLSPDGAGLVAGAPGRLRLDGDAGLGPRLPWQYLPEAPWLLGPALLRPGPTRWGVVLAGLVPQGRSSTREMGDRIRAVHPDRWPEAPTWVVAYRTGDARRAVFGRDDLGDVDLATAVEASSAVPGRFRPVRLDSGRYLDGAVHSPTNADLVAGLGFDLVVVSSPMSVAEGLLDDDDSFGARTRRWCAALLARELVPVVERGTAVLVVQPEGEELAALTAEGDDHDRSPEVAAVARRAVLDRLADPHTAGAVGLLADRATG